MRRAPSIDHTAWAAAITLALALMPWSAFGVTAQLVAVAVAVVLLGLPHGAYDAWLIHERAAGSRRRLAILAAYLAGVVGVFLVWPRIPDLALALFLLTSIVHFGRGDRRVAPFGLPSWVEVPVRGGWVVLAPLGAGGEELEFVFEALTGDASTTWLMVLAELRLPLLALWIATVLVATVRCPRMPVILEGVALGVLALVAPPLMAFAVYFCGWHSTRHLLRLRATGRDWSHIVGRSAPAVVATLALASIAAVVDDGTSAETIARVLFVGLAAVSVPHVVLVDGTRALEAPSASRESAAPV